MRENENEKVCECVLVRKKERERGSVCVLACVRRDNASEKDECGLGWFC